MRMYFLFLFLLVGCDPVVDITSLVKRKVVIEAYSEKPVEMIFTVIGGDKTHYYLSANDSIKDTVMLTVGEVVNWVDRSHKDSFILWYKVYQQDYKDEASEVYCDDNCLGEATGLKVKI